MVLGPDNQDHVFIHILRWFARVSGTIIALAAIVSLFSHPLDFSDLTILLIIERLAFFLMIAGFLAGWMKEYIAGIMILAGYVVFAIINRILYLNWMFALFPLTGFCYLILGYLTHKKNTHFHRSM